MAQFDYLDYAKMDGFSRKSYSRTYQGKVKYRRSSLGMIYTHDVHKNSPIFKTPTHFVHLRPTLFHLLDLRRPISNETPSLQMITNQLKENIIQWWLLHVIRPSFKWAFVFSISLLILPGFLLTCSHLPEASLSPFSWFYNLMYTVVQKNYKISFIHNYPHF